jgi:hypothetical protein
MIERQQNPQVQKIIEWRETLSGMENQQFFSLIHLYLGEVKTPYNKQNLIEQLSSFIRKEENQNLIFNLLSENEILILNAIYFIQNCSQEKLSTFFSGTFSFAFLYETLINLEERLLIYKKIDSDNKTHCYKINPIIEKKLLSVLKLSALLPNPQVEDFQTKINNKNNFQITPLLLGAVYSLVNSNPDLCKIDGTFKKKIQNNFSNIFSSISDSSFIIQIINACKNLSLFTQTENSLEINKSKWNSFSKLSFREQYIYLTISNNSKLTQSDLQKKAILLCAILDNIGTDGFTKKILYRCAYLINEKLSEENFSYSSTSRLSFILNNEKNSTNTNFSNDIFSIIDNAINFGILVHTSNDIYDEPIYTISNNFIFEQEQINQKGLLNIDAGFSATILPGVNLNSILEIIEFMELSRFDTILQMEITKKSCIKSFDAKENPKSICEKLNKFSSHEIPQNLIVSIEDWYENYLSAQIYFGYVLTVTEQKQVLIENNPEISSHIKQILAPGVYLLDFDSKEQVQASIEKSQLDFIGNIKNISTEVSGLPFQKINFKKDLFDKSQIEENPNSQIKDEHLTELKNHLETMDLTKEQYEDLLNRINRKIIISKVQLRKETVKVEKTEAFGMDFSGKIHVIENAISSRNLIEITYESSNSPEGKNIIIGSPLFLTREVSDTFVDVILEPEKTQKTLSLASAISVKKLRGAILN